MRRVSPRRARKAYKDHKKMQDINRTHMSVINALRLSPIAKAVKDTIRQWNRK